MWGWLIAWVVTAIICGALMWRYPASPKFYVAVLAMVGVTVAFGLALWFRLEDHVPLRIDADGVSQKPDARVWKFIPWSDLLEVRRYTDGSKVDAVVFVGPPGKPEKAQSPLLWKGRQTTRCTDNFIYFIGLKDKYAVEELVEKHVLPRLDASTRFEVITLTDLGDDPVSALNQRFASLIAEHQAGV